MGSSCMNQGQRCSAVASPLTDKEINQGQITYLPVCESISFTKTAEFFSYDFFDVLGLGHFLHLFFIKCLSSLFGYRLVVVIHIGAVFFPHGY